MRLSHIDKAIAALRERQRPLAEQLSALSTAINALQEQKEAKPQAAPKPPRKAKKAVEQFKGEID